MRPPIALAALALAATALVAGVAGCGSLPSRFTTPHTVSGDTYTLTLDKRNGSLAALTQKGGGRLFASGEHGLWHVRFRDGSEAKAADFASDSATHSFRTEPGPRRNTARLLYHSAELDVTVTVEARAEGVEFVGEVTPHGKTVLDFALPARLRFAPDAVERFICPANGNQSVGTAFKGAFFKLQPQDRPSGWRSGPSNGQKGYTALFGGPLEQREDDDAPVALRVTADGRTWLGSGTAKRVDGAKAIVNRPPGKGQADVVLVDSANGPYFSAKRLGKGMLWRVGGRVGKDQARDAAAMVGAALRTLAKSAPQGRRTLGLLSLRQGPPNGGWAAVKVTAWLKRLRDAARAARGVQVRELSTVPEMLAALAADECAAIINPYGEAIPVPEPGGVDAVVQAIGRYVRAGGQWFEVGGYPFYYPLRPVRYYHHGTSYPAAFADFFHLDARSGSASLYRVQPQVWPAWEGAKRHETIFIPSRLACGGDEQGGWCDRPFATFVKSGDTWRAPAVRLTVGNTAADSLKAYCKANAITRKLDAKMAPDVLDKFKRSVLVYYYGTAKDKLAHAHLLPVPTQVHFADYLRGGFDKQYPDHLPPHPSFGTPAEFRAFFDKCHALGHLVVPYTNPTWWCDKPKGPTFEKHGDAPLLKNLDGSLSHERYATNDGFTICHWHPAVQAANRETVRQFTEDYPVDVLFQDQCGARRWRYDTNPASPTPYAYIDGLISMVAEDCQRKPLSTEAGWDRVVNYESQLCGLSWSIVPTEGGPAWRRLMKFDYAPDTWEVFPLAQHIAHDKTAMLYHDLGQFVTNRQVLAWTLGLGFCMSYRLGASALTQDAPREWLRWLDRVQKSVCARYVGQGVGAFAHDRGPKPIVADDGVMRATYGPVKVVANLGPKPFTNAGRVLAPFGFVATAPGMVAANLASHDDQGVSFVAEADGRKTQVWVYGHPEQDVCVELPSPVPGAAALTFDDGTMVKAQATGRQVRFRLPNRPGRTRVKPPAQLAATPPTRWPGGPPAIGVLDVEGMGLSWSSVDADEWIAALSRSRLVTRHGLSVQRISSAKALAAALKAGPTRWLGIINPYGEQFPAEAADKWQAMLDAVRHYVNHGGCWWETGGYSLYAAIAPDGRRDVGPSGSAVLGFTVGRGDVDQAPEPLAVPPESRAWLGKELSDRIATLSSAVNRGLVRGSHDPGHVTLVAGARQDFIGGYRLDGWGWLWRIGGFHPNPEVAVPAATAAMEHIATHPPLPVKAGGIRYLWHATVTSQ